MERNFLQTYIFFKAITEEYIHIPFMFSPHQTQYR